MSNILNLNFNPKKANKRKILILVFSIVSLLVAIALGSLLILKLTDNTKKDSNKGVLTIKDLDNPNVDLTYETSDASVKNLTKELKAKINKQIVTKENPIDTVKSLASVLSNTTNEKRQDQLTNFLEDFLNNQSDALWLNYEGDKPDQAQVNYWKGELYAYLVFSFKDMMDSQFMGKDGKALDTRKEQLKYIEMYLNLANDPNSHIAISEENKKFFEDYEYSKTDEFSRLKKEINAG